VDLARIDLKEIPQTDRRRIPARIWASRIGRSSCWSRSCFRCGFSLAAVSTLGGILATSFAADPAFRAAITA
jgi:hypothetical protein